METPHGRAAVERLFGRPAGAGGNLDPARESANIKVVRPPSGWKLFYQEGEVLTPSNGIRVHRLLESSLREVLTEIWNHARLEVKKEVGFNKTSAEYDRLTRAWLHERGMDQHNGGYNFRKVTGGSGLSTHAYGIGIDWDAKHNPRKRPLTVRLPDWWFDIWKVHGWSDGRHFSTPDPMHVQFATGI